MKNSYNYEYEAFVYPKNSFYVADCNVLSHSVYGRSQEEAIESLKKIINTIFREVDVKIKPVFGRI